MGEDAPSPSKELSSLVYFTQEAGPVSQRSRHETRGSGDRVERLQERPPRPEFSPLSGSPMSEIATMRATPAV